MLRGSHQSDNGERRALRRERDGRPAEEIYVFRRGSTGAIATHDFDPPGEKAQFLAFTPDGTRLFVISGDTGRHIPNDRFRILTLFGPAIAVTPSYGFSGEFGAQRVGTYGDSQTFAITNVGDEPTTITSVTLEGANPVDYFGSTTCFLSGRPRVLAGGAVCHVTLYFGALNLGARRASIVVRDTAPGSPHSFALSGTGTEGYFVAGAEGEVGAFGDARFAGNLAGAPLAAPMISVTTTPNGDGYWLLSRDGGVFALGNARFWGSTGAIALNRPVVGMTPTRTGVGYWLVASDGGIFSFGDARFFGSTGNLRLARPIVGMAATPTGHGYWLVASDGGIFSFGDARFFGSTGNLRLARPIVGMVPTPTGHGYTLVASDGGVFTFGDAQFHGSAVGTGASIVGLAASPTGRGYWMLSSAGAVFAFGDAHSYGDLRSAGVTDMIGIAATAPAIPADLLRFSAVGSHVGGAIGLDGNARSRLVFAR